MAGVVLALSGCGQGPKIASDRLGADRASALCAAMDSAAEVKTLVFEQAEKQTAPSNRLALAQLAKQAMLRIEQPLLDSYDTASNKTTCSGQLHLTLPPGAVRNLGDTSDLTASVKFSAQPTPDHIGMTYQVFGAETLISGVAGADITDWASRLQPTGMPQEGAPVPVAAPSALQPPAAAPAAPALTAPQPALAPPPGRVEIARPAPGLAAPPDAPAFGGGLPLLPRCRWARSYADRTICGDPRLEAEDRRIARLYRNALAEDPTGEVRRTAQSERGAREGCQDRDCIEEWFKQREADLSPR